MSPHPSFTFIKGKILSMDIRKVPPWIAVCRDGMKSESRNSRYKVSIISSVHVSLKVSYVSSSSSRSVQMISMKWNDVSRFSRWKFTIESSRLWASYFDLCKYTDDILKDVVRIVLHKMTLKKSVRYYEYRFSNYHIFLWIWRRWLRQSDEKKR